MRFKFPKSAEEIVRSMEDSYKKHTYDKKNKNTLVTGFLEDPCSDVAMDTFNSSVGGDAVGAMYEEVTHGSIEISASDRAKISNLYEYLISNDAKLDFDALKNKLGRDDNGRTVAGISNYGIFSILAYLYLTEPKYSMKSLIDSLDKNSYGTLYKESRKYDFITVTPIILSRKFSSAVKSVNIGQESKSTSTSASITVNFNSGADSAVGEFKNSLTEAYKKLDSFNIGSRFNYSKKGDGVKLTFNIMRK